MPPFGRGPAFGAAGAASLGPDQRSGGTLGVRLRLSRTPGRPGRSLRPGGRGEGRGRRGAGQPEPRPRSLTWRGAFKGLAGQAEPIQPAGARRELLLLLPPPGIPLLDGSDGLAPGCAPPPPGLPRPPPGERFPGPSFPTRAGRLDAARGGGREEGGLGLSPPILSPQVDCRLAAWLPPSRSGFVLAVPDGRLSPGQPLSGGKPGAPLAASSWLPLPPEPPAPPEAPSARPPLLLPPRGLAWLGAGSRCRLRGPGTCPWLPPSGEGPAAKGQRLAGSSWGAFTPPPSPPPSLHWTPVERGGGLSSIPDRFGTRVCV